MIYKVLVVDDEVPAREKINRFLLQYPAEFDIQMAINAMEAIHLLAAESFDLLFLDVQMPQMDAFSMIDQIGLEQLPAIIFSTAYNHYAVKAFEVHAIDYLLKPYNYDRFQVAVDKVLDQFQFQLNPHVMLENMLKSLSNQQKYPSMIWVNQGGKLIPLDVQQIEYLESDGNYVQIYTSKHKFLVRQSLVDLASKLNPDQFVRVHRSFVVNQQQITAVHPKSHGDMFAILQSEKKVPISRRYKQFLIGS